MKTTFILLSSVLFFSTQLSAQKAGKTDTTKHPSFYTCSMHPEVMLMKPGKCPKCGMDLILSKKEEAHSSSQKQYNCPIHLNVTSHDPGKCPQCGRKLTLSPKEQMKAEVMKTYICPMHPDVALDKDGKCPKCGRALVEKGKKN